MTDKEKIRKYIEELHKTHKGSSGDWYFRLALRTVLHFIDSMQELPVSKDLDEAADKCASEMWDKMEEGEYDIAYVNFINGVNWQKERMVQQLEDIVYRRYSDDGDTNQRNKDLIKLIQNWKG